MHGIFADGPTGCSICGGSMRKLLSAPAIHFKGSGWAKKDAQSAAASSKKASTDATSADSKGTKDGDVDGAEAKKASSTDGDKDAGSDTSSKEKSADTSAGTSTSEKATPAPASDKTGAKSTKD